VRRLGRDGERLNPRKADLQAWREGFARALRDRSVEAEATPRRTRGVSRKAERIPVRKMRERFAAGQGPLPEVLAVAYRAALTKGEREAPWLEAIQTRELAIRRVLVAEALRLSRSERPGDRALAALVERFVRDRPAPMTRDQALRQRWEAQRDLGRTRDR
jgi:type IV secretory pathway VirD2 relaxase